MKIIQFKSKEKETYTGADDLLQTIVTIPTGGTAVVSDKCADRLLADFPNDFRLVSDKKIPEHLMEKEQQVIELIKEKETRSGSYVKQLNDKISTLEADLKRERSAVSNKQRDIADMKEKIEAAETTIRMLRNALFQKEEEIAALNKQLGRKTKIDEYIEKYTSKDPDEMTRAELFEAVREKGIKVAGNKSNEALKELLKQ